MNAKQPGNFGTGLIAALYHFDGDCDICEASLSKEIELDLERKELENQRLKREIELMEKDQEHRCCPADSKETPATA